MQNFNDGNVQRIEKRTLDKKSRESGVKSTRTPSSSQILNENNTSFGNVESTAVAAQLRNLFPTVGKSSFGGKSCNSKCDKVKKPPVKKAKKSLVDKDVILLPSPNTRSVPTHRPMSVRKHRICCSCISTGQVFTGRRSSGAN